MILSNGTVEEFKTLIKEGRFYEAHECFEILWFPNREHKTPFYNTLKGFINASVSLELYKRGRVNQSKQVWNNYTRLVQIDEIDDINLQKKLFEIKYFLDDFQALIYSR
ncbi:MAG: DUF309 domain-containing protein [Campylobacterota bacterium]